VPHTGNESAEGHGLILLRRKPVQLTIEDLQRPEPGEDREVQALAHHVEQLRRETVELRTENVKLRAAATSPIRKAVRATKDVIRRRVR
jgi:hypothetical protein